MCFKTLPKLFQNGLPLVVSTSLRRGQDLEKAQTFTLIWSTSLRKIKQRIQQLWRWNGEIYFCGKLVEFGAGQSTYKGSCILCVLSSDQVSSSRRIDHSCSHTLLYHTHQIGSLGHSTSGSHGDRHPTLEEQRHNCICPHTGHRTQPWPGIWHAILMVVKKSSIAACSRILLLCWLYYELKVESLLLWVSCIYMDLWSN